MKLIKGLIITLITLIAITGVVAVGGYIYVRSQYDIDLFNTVNQLKILSKNVDEKELCPNAFSKDDMKKVKDTMDQYIGGFITYEEGKGYEGYTVHIPPSSPVMTIEDDIILSSKEAGALAQTIFYQQTGGKIKISEKEVAAHILQVDFKDVLEDGSADFNIITKIELNSLKNEMKKFPMNWLKKYVPEELYISSVVHVGKLDKEMGYKVTHKELKLNQLSFQDTIDFFHTLDVLLKVGSVEELNKQIGETAVNALIGDSSHVGFAYSMRHYGKTTFEFASLDMQESYFIIS